MVRRIVIVGGLENNPDPTELLAQLRSKTGGMVDWQWLKAEPPSYSIRQEDIKDYKRFLHGLRVAHHGRKKQNEPPATVSSRSEQERPSLHVLKLHCLNGRIQNEIFRAYPEPTLVPKRVSTLDALVDWICSPEANLFPRREWFGNCLEAAMVAILEKLIRNKSWNKDQQGHQWTKEEDLLGQAPVHLPDSPEIRQRAEHLLDTLKGKLFLTKGGTQGQTPKEWSISITHLPSVKRAIIEQSFAPLAGCAELTALIHRASKEQVKRFLLHEIVSERVRLICRQRD